MVSHPVRMTSKTPKPLNPNQRRGEILLFAPGALLNVSQPNPFAIHSVRGARTTPCNQTIKAPQTGCVYPRSASEPLLPSLRFIEEVFGTRCRTLAKTFGGSHV